MTYTLEIDSTNRIYTFRKEEQEQFQFKLGYVLGNYTFIIATSEGDLPLSLISNHALASVDVMKDVIGSELPNFVESVAQGYIKLRIHNNLKLLMLDNIPLVSMSTAEHPSTILVELPMGPYLATYYAEVYIDLDLFQNCYTLGLEALSDYIIQEFNHGQPRTLEPAERSTGTGTYQSR